MLKLKNSDVANRKNTDYKLTTIALSLLVLGSIRHKRFN